MIQIFTTGPGCNRCNLLKEAFWRADIAYDEKPLDFAVQEECLMDTDIWVVSAPLVKDNVVWKFQDDFFDAAGNLLPGWLKNMRGIKPHKAGFTGTAKTEEKKQKCSKIWCPK